MHSGELKELLHANPFRPFTVFLPSEKGFTIPHEDFAWLTPTGRTLAVAVADKDGMSLLDVAMIARIEVQEAPQAR